MKTEHVKAQVLVMNTELAKEEAARSALTGDAIRLMCQLEKKVAVTALADDYPRVLNRIAALWSRPVELRAYFDGLLLDNRGNREGFPFKVLTQINALQHFYVTVVNPKHVDPWDRMMHL